MHHKVIPIAQEAGLTMLKMWNDAEISTRKGEYDFALNVDHAVEEYAMKELKKLIPDCGFISEEAGIIDPDREYQWVIDPLDGTKNYANHSPLFNISIALLKNKEIIFGLVYAPVTGELFYANKGKGAYIMRTLQCGDFFHEEIKPIEVSTVSELNRSYIYIEFFSNKSKQLEENITITEKIIHKIHRTRSFGSAALALCYTAMGAYEGYIDFARVTKLHDVAAGVLIIEEAGGTVTDINGGVYTIDSRQLAATNGLVHHDLLALI